MTERFLKFFGSIKELPSAGRVHQAEAGVERWLAQASKEDAPLRRYLVEHDGGVFLRAIFGNSTFLTQCVMSESSLFFQILEKGPKTVSNAIIDKIEVEIGQENNLTNLMFALRRAKRQIAMLVAIADIADLWSVDQVTSTLSQFADTATNIAVRFGLRQLSNAEVLQISASKTPEKFGGYAIIGVGKLGAQELNYSSDIDLIAIYDPGHITTPQPDKLSRVMVRLTRLIIKILEERTQDGYVFRTDFRIRPAPGSTPLAIPIDSAVGYYESIGQNWERLAMIRARPVAGDTRVSDDFISRIRPFVWRRNLDFAAIQDIHSVKRQIAAFRGGDKISINGHNIKVGRGGIREIEFFVQTQQLIWGGRIPALRTRDLVETLYALATENRISAKVSKDLGNAYVFLRHLEHRLQMVDDRQTHDLPKTDEGIEAISKFAGFPDAPSFRKKLRKTLKTVELHYARLFEDSTSLGAEGNLVFTGVENDADTLVNLRKMGFTDPESISEAVRNWHRGQYRATRTERARQIITELMPHLLKTFGTRSQPDRAFMRFDAFLKALPSGVQTLSLFANSPSVLDLITDIMGNAPKLAARLSKNPGLLDHVLSQDFYSPLGNCKTLIEDLSTNLQHANDFQDQLDIVRRWTNDKKFQNGTQLLLGAVKGHKCCETLSDIAETALQAMFECASNEFKETHGFFKTGSMAILAFGKLGGRELMQGSDLDLVFVYSHSPSETRSNGAKPLDANIYFMRLAQRIITALTVLTGEGRLYDVDNRLRPNGKKAPIATRILSFEQYYATSAWTWEYMALSKARVIVGPTDLSVRLETMRHAVLSQEREQAKLVSDVCDMRNRIANEFPGRNVWDIKYRPGGLIDAEFMAQYLQLLHAAACPKVLSPNTINSFHQLNEHGFLNSKVANDLIGALTFWYDLGSALRITTTEDLENKSHNSGPREMLAQAGNATNFDELVEKMQDTAHVVRKHFNQLIRIS